MKKTSIKLMTTILIGTLLLSACGKKGAATSSEKDSKADAKQTQELQIDKDKTSSSSSNKTFTKFFFSGIESKKQYTYEGTVWGDNNLGDPGSEEVNKEGEVLVNAKLSITEIADLPKGKVYELNFSIYGKKSNIKEKSEVLYIWATEDKIYQFGPSDEFDYKGIVESGQVNYIKCAKLLQERKQLPSTDEDMLLCANESNKSTNGTWDNEITVENNTVTFHSIKKDSPDFSKFVWETGKGLVNYSWGQGAKAAGVDLKMVK